MKAILGLGNPGLIYRFSRHNLGFLVVEKLARAKKIRLVKRAFNCLLGQGAFENQQVLLAKPLTFVNVSGQAALLIVKRKKIHLKDLLIICDDVNLPLGKIRIGTSGSDGGHKGLRSIIEALDSRDFSRLRIGIGRPARPEFSQAGGPEGKAEGDKLSRHVLGKFYRREIKIINEAIEKAAAASEVWTKEGIAAAMNKFN